MKKATVFYLFIALVCLTISTQAQIPNPDFESWENDEPVGWNSNNVTALGWYPITQSTSSHSGSSALKGEVISAMGVPLPPLVFTQEFTVSQRYAELTGWYWFSQINGDQFVLSVGFLGEDIIGGGVLLVSNPAEGFTPFTVPIYYDGSGTPTSATIAFDIRDSSEVDIGSYFIVDDLSFQGVAAVPEKPISQAVPVAYSLHQNYPNPFNPVTTIAYDVTHAGPVELTVFDLLGNEVTKLASGNHLTGSYTVTWNAADLPSGMYLYQMKAGDFLQTRKLVLMK